MIRPISLMALLLAAGMALPQGQAKRFTDVAEITATLTPAQAKAGDTVTLRVTVMPKPGAWTYAFVQPDGKNGQGKIDPRHPALKFESTADPDGWKDEADLATGDTLRKYKVPVTWVWKATVTGPVGTAKIDWNKSSLQACTSTNCFPAPTSAYPETSLEVLPGYTPTVTNAPPEPSEKSAAPPVLITTTSNVLQKKPALTTEEYQAKLEEFLTTLDVAKVERQGGLVTLLLTAAFWGFVSLITPCVFPMIPITVSLFLKQANQSTSGAIRQALIYCLTITVVLGLSAVSLLSVFRAMSVNPIMNIALGLLFLAFALSLFGLYILALPNFLLKYSEGKRKQGGIFAPVFGAIAFSIVSFTCVAPFLGGFAGMASSGNYNPFELVLAGLTFGASFAAPFFVLAVFPSLLKKLPKSGGWLDTVKVVMGFLEVAAALKFFRTAELGLVPQTAIFTYDLVLSGWVALYAVTGAYLLNLFRLPHDEETPSIGAVRLLFALLFLGLALYLLPGIFKQTNGENMQPRGAVFGWVDAFLLPEPSEGELPWGTDLVDALAASSTESARTGKPKYVFVDFTGVTCTNCKANERKIFPRSDVRVLLEQYQLVQLYTDNVPVNFYANPPSTDARKDEGSLNLAFQSKAFGTEQLPLYAILQKTRDGRTAVVSLYGEGLINDTAAFVEFLKMPLSRLGK